MNSLKSSPEDSYETYKMDAFCSFRNRTVLFCVSRRIRICCRIRHDNIRLYLSYFFRDHLIQRQRRGHKKLSIKKASCHDVYHSTRLYLFYIFFVPEFRVTLRSGAGQ